LHFEDDLAFRNAIKVENIGLAQVGHLPRNVVAKLSPLLDQQAITVEGVINDGNRKRPHFSQYLYLTIMPSRWISVIHFIYVCILPNFLFFFITLS
jgi:hypothetical protein